MKALVFQHSLAREAAAAAPGQASRRAYVSRLAPIRLAEVSEPSLPAPDWVRVETTLSGLGGSDVKQIMLNGARDNPLTALKSFPHVLGHEAVGRRTLTPASASCSTRGCPAEPRGVRAAVPGVPGRPVSVVLHVPLRQSARLDSPRQLRRDRQRAFGIEATCGVTKHAMEHYFDFVAADLDLTPLIIHRFPLERWPEAVLAVKNSRHTGAVRVLLEPGRDTG